MTQAVNIPNLDAMSRTDLLDFEHEYGRPNRAQAAYLIGDTRPGYTGLTKTIAGYAGNKAAAMYCRTKGDITGASVYERICDNIYDSLPTDLKW